MKAIKIDLWVLAISGLLLIASCDEIVSKSQTGTVDVLVVDLSTNQLVKDVEIEIMPIGLIQKTGEDGKAVFQVEPGQYFVDASVCCIGPGNIQYHELVTVTANKTIEVTLNACLFCL